MILFAISGAVVAAWLINGSGSGQAVAGEAQDVTLTAGTPTDLLYPGGSAGVATRVTNPNPFPVLITAFAQNGVITSSVAGCDASNHEVTFTTQNGEWEVGASSAGDFELAGAISMGLGSADACQGATFTIPLVVTAMAGTIGSPTGTTTPGGAEITWYADADTDQYGDPEVTAVGSTPPAGYVSEGTDCNDADSTIFPGAPELADAVDNDCDGIVDEARAPLAGDLVINEIMFNPLTEIEQYGEWFEVFNASVEILDLQGVIISSGTASQTIGSVVIPPGGYAVMAAVASSVTNGGVTPDFVYGTSIVLNNTTDDISLTGAGGALLDRVVWDGGVTFPNPNGASIGLADPSLDNGVGANWCAATSVYGVGGYGTPGMVNDPCSTT